MYWTIPLDHTRVVEICRSRHLVKKNGLNVSKKAGKALDCWELFSTAEDCPDLAKVISSQMWSERSRKCLQKERKAKRGKSREWAEWGTKWRRFQKKNRVGLRIDPGLPPAEDAVRLQICSWPSRNGVRRKKIIKRWWGATPEKDRQRENERLQSTGSGRSETMWRLLPTLFPLPVILRAISGAHN